jgi:vitamin B12 transporter
MSLNPSIRTPFRFARLALAFGFALTTSLASAAEISGSVTTETGLPVSQAVVRLTSATMSREVVTGSRGEFKVDLPDGAYVASVHGFDVDAAPIVVAGRGISLDIALRPAKIREEVIVAATRSRTTVSSVGVSASVLDANDLEERQTLRLTDMLAELPGLNVAGTGGVGAQSSLFVRGGESRFARILIDGVPVNEPGGFFNFGALLTPDIERVEVVRGSFGTLYGSDALAGVVALETSAPGAGRRLRGEAGGGDLGTRSYSATGSETRGLLSGSLSLGRSRTDNEGPNADFTSNLFAASLERRLTTDGAVQASFRLNTSDGGTPGPTLFGRPDRDARYERDLLIASVGARFRSGALSHAARVGFKRDDQLSRDPLDSGSFRPAYGSVRAAFDSSDFPDPLGYANRTDRLFGTYELRGQVRSHSLTAGGDIDRESGNLGNVGETPLSPRRVSYGAFLQDQIALTSSAFGTLSLRAERNGSTGTTLVPHASLAWVASRNPDFDLALRASAGAGIKAPSFFESYGTSSFALGNPDLKPERARTWDAGFDLRLGDDLKVQATYFHHQYLDQIAYKVVSFSPFVGTYENLGETEAQGFEFSGEWRPSERLRLTSSYTALTSRVLTSTSTDPLLAVGQELLRRPRHQASLTAEGALARATLAATLVTMGRRADSDFLGLGLTENPGFTRVDVRGAVRLNPHARILAAVENLFDATYQEVLGYAALPRRFRVSLSLDSAK